MDWLRCGLTVSIERYAWIALDAIVDGKFTQLPVTVFPGTTINNAVCSGKKVVKPSHLRKTFWFLSDYRIVVPRKVFRVYIHRVAIEEPNSPAFVSVECCGHESRYGA